MKLSTSLISVIALLSISFAQEMRTFKDSRDGKIYKTVLYNGTEWFAENANYNTPNSYCLFDKKKNCEIFGRMYTQKSIQNACPSGWHASTWDDWELLVINISRIFANEEKLLSHGDPETEGQVMWQMAMMYNGWIPNPETNGKTQIANPYDGFINQSNFTALPGGVREGSGEYNYVPQMAFFWMMGKNPAEDYPIVLQVSARPDVVGTRYPLIRNYNDLKNAGVYVRCVKNESMHTKDIDKDKKGVAGLQPTGKTQLGGRRAKVDYAEGGSGGLGDGLADLLGGGGGGVSTKAMGSIKTPSASDIDVVGDSRSAADIMKVVKQRTPGLRYIYNKHLKKKPGFQGVVTLKLKISPGGEIISISVASTTGYGEFDSEVKSAVNHWKFSAVQYGNTIVTIPFTFSIDDDVETIEDPRE